MMLSNNKVNYGFQEGTNYSSPAYLDCQVMSDALQGIADLKIDNEERQQAATMIVSAYNRLRERYDCTFVDDVLYKCMKLQSAGHVAAPQTKKGVDSS